MAENNYSPEVLDALKKDILASMHCALPGIVESYNADTQTASVSPALRSRAGQDVVQLPLLTDVPVFIPGSERNNWTVAAGDSCLLIFADSCIDGWFETDSAALPPSGRQHDLSDAFAFVGFRPRMENP